MEAAMGMNSMRSFFNFRGRNPASYPGSYPGIAASACYACCCCCYIIFFFGLIVHYILFKDLRDE